MTLPDLEPALEPFTTFAQESVEKTDSGWQWSSGLGRDRICDWFGPSDFGLLAHFANALSAARSAPEAGKAVVKPLEWQEPSSKNNHCWTADSPFGTYSVVNEDGWYACRDEAPRGFYFEWSWRDMSRDNLLTAQAACQADYEQRILSALASVAPPGAEPAAWRRERDGHLIDQPRPGYAPLYAAPQAVPAEDVASLKEWKAAIIGLCRALGSDDMDWGGDKTGWGFIFYFVKHLHTRLTASEAEAADLRRKLEEHQDAEDKAAREMATVIQGLRNRATAAERKLEEARKALSTEPGEAEGKRAPVDFYRVLKRFAEEDGSIREGRLTALSFALAAAPLPEDTHHG